MMATILIAGGAGFLGRAMATQLLHRGDLVVCVDNFVTSERGELSELLDNSMFTLIEQDICVPIEQNEAIDAVVDLASPASPIDYLRLPIETLRVGSVGVLNLLDLARTQNARFLLSSTSEVYGDPLEHPQVESYWGNVNPIGPRSVYDESKRFAEAATMANRRTFGVDTRIARIFNTYGPGMRPNDGRVVSTFIRQALLGEDLTIFGDGSQTRSFCYVDDLVRGLIALLDADPSVVAEPINIGNPGEFTVAELAALVLGLIDTPSKVVHLDLPENDPTRRRPDITRAQELLGWSPTVPLADGVARTIEHMAATLL
ncbi:MAG: NAD-dependent epimerase/dehydratase family protein [Actinobacteria bacterium]|nr:NAD-dependent epimerase/dehydratase family protein [Actinomycetota bacterium]MTA76924.1 NAD-dependent epimerase/dehydratase family protein [Actinomycetota bacterium]